MQDDTKNCRWKVKGSLLLITFLAIWFLNNGTWNYLNNQIVYTSLRKWDVNDSFWRVIFYFFKHIYKIYGSCVTNNPSYVISQTCTVYEEIWLGALIVCYIAIVRKLSFDICVSAQ